MLINSAYAQAAEAAAQTPSMFGTVIQLVLIFAIFYFLLIRPQKRAMQAHQEMLNTVKKGDKILTAGGVFGIVKKSTDDELTVEIAKDVEIQVSRSTVKTIVTDEKKDEKVTKSKAKKTNK